jgi:hypothetical protein
MHLQSPEPGRFIKGSDPLLRRKLFRLRPHRHGIRAIHAMQWAAVRQFGDKRLQSGH